MGRQFIARFEAAEDVAKNSSTGWGIAHAMAVREPNGGKKPKSPVRQAIDARQTQTSAGSGFIHAGISIFLAVMLVGCGKMSPHNPASTSRTPTPNSAGVPAGIPGRIAFSDYPVPTQPPATPDLLQLGRSVYDQYCVMCHGANGDGQGRAAQNLSPKPRNFHPAAFRLRSTSTSHLPTDHDLFRSVSLGLPGTMMPPWRHILDETSRWAVVAHIKTLSPRFAAPGENRPIVELGHPPARNADTIAQGRRLFSDMGCVQCHGQAGRGDGDSAPSLTDDSGMPIKPRDFANPPSFKSGYSTRDLVRAMITGFDGTPMAGFNGAIKPEDAWKIAFYLETIPPSTPVPKAGSDPAFWRQLPTDLYPR